MPKQIVISEQLRIAALLTDERVEELIVAQGRYQIGDVYLGTVENVLPGIDAAFVNIGESEKNGFIHVSDLGPLRLKKEAAGITELLEPRQQVLVQVIKEPTGTKGPRLTGNLALPGRYLVLQPHGQGVNISRKINSESERNRLRALGVLIKPPGTGLLIRTEANGVSEDLLIDDLESLLKQWEAIQLASENSIPPVLLNRDEDFIHRILRDHIGPDVLKVVVENISAVERVTSFLGQNSTNLVVEPHKESAHLLDYYRINTAIRDALKPRVDLPSGGYIIIEPTEALTVIDVNSGSFTRSANSRETVLWTNCEAAIEIARQLKLRNIGGVIIVDFIDMESRRDQLQLLEHFTSAIKNDSARPQIAQLTELGLVELTRKRQGQNVYELFARPCNHCNGLGHEAVFPGKDILEPLATATGLVRTGNAHKIEATTEVENPNNRRKKNGRVKLNNESFPVNNSEEVTNYESNSAINDSQENNPISEITNNKKEPELIAINMDLEQEEVFSFLGLNPTLLLESQPENENHLIRIIRPEEDQETILEEARKQLINNLGKKKRRGKSHNFRIDLKDEIVEESNSKEEDICQVSEKQANITDLLVEEIKDIQNDNENSKDELPKSASEDLTDEEEDPRRRRRRSSANK